MAATTMTAARTASAAPIHRVLRESGISTSSLEQLEPTSSRNACRKRIFPCWQAADEEARATARVARHGDRVLRLVAPAPLPQPGISLRFAFPQTHYGVQQGAHCSRIARHALPEDLVAAKRTRKLDAMARPQEIQQAPVSLLGGDIDDIERDEPESAPNSLNPDVMEPVAPTLGGPNPNDRPVLRDAIQRPRRSVKLRPVPLRCHERILCMRTLPVLHPRPLGEGAGGQKRQAECDTREQDGGLHRLL
jgi:hypothetical protein